MRLCGIPHPTFGWATLAVRRFQPIALHYPFDDSKVAHDVTERLAALLLTCFVITFLYRENHHD